MKKSDINPLPEYFDRYINLVGEVELPQAFAQSGQQLKVLDKNLLGKADGKRYADGKWTVKENLQHVIDWERILSYRALLYARNKGAAAQSIDGDLFAANMNANRRAIEDLTNELEAACAATEAMFASFDDEMLRNTGICWKSEMSVLAMGFLIVGHRIHHLKIIEEKYLFPIQEAA